MTSDRTNGNLSPGSGLRTSRWLGIGLLCAIAFSFGASAMTGWIFDLPQWRSFLASGSQMKANSAFCLMLLASATALCAFNLARRWSRTIANILAAVVGLITALTFSEYLFEVDLGIDQLLFYNT